MTFDKSELDQIIPPEVHDDNFYHTIEKLAREERIKNVLEIGSSSGAGSTRAFISGLQQNAGKPTLYCMELSRARFAALQQSCASMPFVKCYNTTSVASQHFAKRYEVVNFYNSTPSALNAYPLERVLGWLDQDLAYLEREGINEDGIARIKRENQIEHFDMVLIDGSEFTGQAELEQIYGAGIIMLDDINAFKNRQNYDRLKRDPEYQLITEDWKARNGFAIFRRRRAAVEHNAMPIEFFTIVLNGEPFIRHHIEQFKQLTIPWRWHIIEGVASLVKDTAWSVSTGGNVPKEFHLQGRSTDGTTEYIDSLVREHPGRVEVYRKPFGQFWDGKVEMCNAPLPNLEQPALLWQLDNDELWSPDQIQKMHAMFVANPDRTGAFVPCHYFVGPKKYVATLNTWATMPEDWPRLWTYRPGMRWATHEPAVLVDQAGRDVLRINPFTRDEILKAGLTFQHFAYTTKEQVEFKEFYYGYPHAVSHWKRLQAQTEPVNPAHYLPWARNDGALVKDWTPQMGPLLGERWLAANNPGASNSAAVPAAKPKQYASVTIDEGTQFENELRELFKRIRPSKIIETGTYHGKGTTSIIWRALRDLQIQADFTTIEVNPVNYSVAQAHFQQNQMNLRAELGLTLPRSFLPTPVEIEDKFVRNREFKEGVYYDHDAAERVNLYHAETNFDVPDDMLRKAMQRVDFKPDFVLLDSAGHVGTLEFEYFLSMIQGPCYLMCDDIYHCKHHQSLLTMKADPRFEILVESTEKFGFGIAKFTPLRSVVWIRPDSIGDAVISCSMLEQVKKRFNHPRVTVVCKEHVQELYQSSPFVDQIIAFDRFRLEREQPYRDEIAAKLQDVRADLVLNSVFSRDTVTDFLAINCAAAKSIALAGDDSNMPTEQRLNLNRLYTRTIESPGQYKTEAERHLDFLSGLGIKAQALTPTVWLTAGDREFAQSLFAAHGLNQSTTIALFAGAQHPYRHYAAFGEALRAVAAFRGYTVIALGSAGEYELNQHAIDASGLKGLNLSGKLSLRQAAAIIEKCRLAFGTETSLAHMACAVGTQNVILLGGGHYGRFFPYSALSTVVVLPLECFGCNWQCRYSRPHCVQDLRPQSLAKALEGALANAPGALPRILYAAETEYQAVGGAPQLAAASSLARTGNWELVTFPLPKQSPILPWAGSACQLLA